MRQSAAASARINSDRGDYEQTRAPTTPEIALGDYHTLDQIRFLIRQFLKASESMAVAKGLTGQQHQLLLALAGRAPGTPPTIGYLADRLMIKHHSAVGLIDRLAVQGFVEREADATDRRVVLVRLTDAGIAVLTELAASHQRELRSLAPHLVSALSLIAGNQGDAEMLGEAEQQADHEAGEMEKGNR